MYKFENKLPSTLSYWKENGLFHVKNTNFNITIEEARACAELYIEAINDKDTKAVVLDNREGRGAYKQEILQLWIDLNLGEIINKGNKKFVTLTNNSVAAMQTNRIAKNTGSNNMSRAFNSDLNEEVMTFIEGEQ